MTERYPFLASIVTNEVRAGEYPFTIPVLQRGLKLQFPTPVTFLVGENGTGKSTILEGIAARCGFGDAGGDRQQHAHLYDPDWAPLAKFLRASWRRQVTQGFFLRAESFYNFATMLDESGSSLGRYGGRSLHAVSHGESFLALFEHKFEDGLFLLDEPEAALSPTRLMTLLRVMHDMVQGKVAQFIICTHSPILMTFPAATIYLIEGAELRQVEYEQTEHFRLTRDFLNHPDRYLKALFRDEE